MIHGLILFQGETKKGGSGTIALIYASAMGSEGWHVQGQNRCQNGQGKETETGTVRTNKSLLDLLAISSMFLDQTCHTLHTQPNCYSAKHPPLERTWPWG